MLWSHLCKGIRKSFWNNRNIKGKGEINGNFIIDYVFRRKWRFSLASSWRLLNTNSSISLYIELDSGYMCIFYHCCSALSHVWLSATPWTAAGQASLSLPLKSLLKLMSIESVIPSNHFILSFPSPSAQNLSHYLGFF